MSIVPSGCDTAARAGVARSLSSRWLMRAVTSLHRAGRSSRSHPGGLRRPLCGRVRHVSVLGNRLPPREMDGVGSTLNEIGGRGTLDVRVVDAASGAPLSDSAGGISGVLEVLLGPRASVALPVEWRRPIPEGGPGRIPPAQLAFLITAQLTDSMGNRVSETVTVREKLPRPWQIF